MVLTRRRYTFDEWIESPEATPRAELSEGVSVERPVPSRDHQRIIRRLERWLSGAEDAGLGEVGLGPEAVLLDPEGSRRNAREPDLNFVRDERCAILTSRAVEGIPDLIIEVLSSTNRQDDLPGGPVFRDYERFGVPVYWVVDPATRAIIQYERRRARLVEVARLGDGDILTTSLWPGSALALADLFAGL